MREMNLMLFKTFQDILNKYWPVYQYQDYFKLKCLKKIQHWLGNVTTIGVSTIRSVGVAALYSVHGNKIIVLYEIYGTKILFCLCSYKQI